MPAPAPTTPATHGVDEPLSLVWLREDLRLSDNEALTAAAARGAVAAVFVHEPEAATGVREPGTAAAWWLRTSLDRLRADLAAHGVELIEAAGDPRRVLPELCARLGAGEVHAQRRHHRPLAELDDSVAAALRPRVRLTLHSGHLLTEPKAVATATGTPYKVFTPFARRAADLLALPAELGEPRPVPAGLHGPAPRAGAAVDRNGRAGAASASDPADLAGHNDPGEAGAQAALAAFLDGLGGSPGYETGRDLPAEEATSGLSAHLRSGEISPRQVWAETAARAEADPLAAGDARAFLRQLLWRDFAWHRLHHRPDLAVRNVRAQFDDFGWEWFPAGGPAEHTADLRAWQDGRTGIPLVDAGMRELAATGRMHNRVRMVTASFLTKNLGIHWRHGEEFFWDRLVDADHAANPFNWQWVAGCGDDAAPYFRIFNPVTQAKRFDPHGEYVRRWVPEVHTAAYPEPMVDLKDSRRRALAAYERIKNR